MKKEKKGIWKKIFGNKLNGCCCQIEEIKEPDQRKDDEKKPDEKQKSECEKVEFVHFSRNQK